MSNFNNLYRESTSSGASSPRSNPAVVIATSSSPNESGIGSIFLNDFIAGCPEFSFATSKVPPFLYPAETIAPSLRRKLQGAFTHLGRVVPYFHSARVNAFRKLAIRKYVARIKDHVVSTEASCIWLTASSPELIAVGAALVNEGYDVRTTVWDTPEYFLNNLMIGGKQRILILEEFALLLKKSRKVSVISNAMNELYRPISGKDSIILRHGIHAEAPTVRRITDNVRIVFSGSMYSKTEWNAFIDTLDHAGWMIAGHQVELYFIGHFPAHGATRSPKARYLGQMSFSDTMKALGQMHIGYLPYWFSPKHELVARTSFPGKLSAYAAAGLAVFHHAPSYTEVASFLTEYTFGTTCSSLERNRIHEALSDLIECYHDPALALARRLAVIEELSGTAMAARFTNFLAADTAIQST